MKKHVVLVALPLLFSTIGFSYELDQVLFQIDKNEKAAKTVKFEFTQEVSFTGTDMKSQVKGEALFSKPRKLMIRKISPEEQVTISNGDKMWIYTPAYNQVWEGRWQDWVHASMLPSGLLPVNEFVADLKENFNLRLESGKNDKEVRLLADSRDPSSKIRLEFTISTESWFPVETVFDSETAKIVTALVGLETNVDIPESSFNFSPPKGAEIISMN